MGLASNQARLNVLTCRKADLEYRLMIISNQQLRLATEKAEEVSKKSQALDAYVKESQDENVSFRDTQAYIDYETAMNELEAADLRLTQQQQVAQTELSAVDAEKEEVEKLVSSNAKNCGYFN